MKKLGLFGGLAILIVIIAAAVMAGRMGETSHAYARGTVVLDPAVADKANGVQTLFVIASGMDRPMPLGALRKTLSGPDPGGGTIYEFVLTNESMMRMDPNAAFPQEFKLKARLDQDGTAGPDQPGDLVGEVNPVHLGAEGVEIRINKVIP
jgi:hypothetical protein